MENPILHLIEENGNVEAICPFCKKEIQDTYFITDRCSIGWFWCNNCEKTGILDYNIGNNPKKELERHLTLKREDCKIYDIPLLKIKRTTGSVLFLRERTF